MSEVLGLIDALEASVLEGKKIPLTEKVVVSEVSLLEIIDKIRLVIKSDQKSFVREAVDVSNKSKLSYEFDKTKSSANPNIANDSTLIVLKDAEKQAQEVKEGADEYADYILANLQLMLAKLQKNMVGLEKNIEDGRDVLKNKQRDIENKSVLSEEMI
jgi:hypothetical protein